ncbi:MAG TPA: DNA translocase FtsK 4TM domain-containing protein [Thermoleophilia bacterium]|nr:DNA translocase FtsK 4TM domain-containing protein [Thermoleophilia bacterium]
MRHRRELAAIACVAIAVFLVFVLYLGWDGGSLGLWLANAVRWMVGLLAFAFPVLLCCIAYLLVAPRDRRPRRGVIWGVGLIIMALLLAAAGDAFGVFTGDRPQRLFRDAYMSAHGGFAGELMWGGLSGIIGRMGVDVLVVALLLAGVLLVTGASLRQWASRSRHGLAVAGRAARGQAESLGVRRRESTSVLDAEPDGVTSIVPDMAQTGIVRVSEYTSTAVIQAGTLIDGEQDTPDIFGGLGEITDDPEPEPVESSPTGPGDDVTVQLSLAEAAIDTPGGEAAALTFKGVERREWILPKPELLQRLGEGKGETQETILNVSRRLVETLGHFGVEAHIIGTVSGPRVTRYELQLAPGIKVSRVAGLKDDIAYALAATDVRVQAPIPGKTAVGVEVPNLQANYVSLGDIHGPFPAQASPMSFWIGKDVTGKAVPADLVKMVHLLVAGTTGSGKSGCLNALISSVMLRATPDQVRMIMIDPKKVELSSFDGIPHLLAPVVTNMKQATYVLGNICREMDRRYDVLSRHACQDVRVLNRKLVRDGEETMPYIMVVIDELADLMMVAPSEVEESIIRLGQLGRSCGIHLVVATQRPSVDVVTGMIKTNIPSRIAFAVSSQTDSRIILDQGGAESLLGMGDMLFSPMGSNRLLRVQGALITAHEMKLITEHWKRQAKPDFREDLLESPAGVESDRQPTAANGDELLSEAIRTVVLTGAASVALLQRRLRVGYARAGRLIDIMEEMGIVSGYDGSKARAVLISEDELPSKLARLRGEESSPEQTDAIGEPPLDKS